MTCRIFTIGHGRAQPQTIAALLDGLKIKTLIDVRSKTYSRNPHFNRGKINKWLSQIGVGYVWYGATLGGFGGPSVSDPDFLRRMKRVVERSEEGPVAMMCSESTPEICHRAVKLTAWLLRNTELEVEHILHSGELLEAREFEKTVVPSKMWHEYGGKYGAP